MTKKPKLTSNEKKFCEILKSGFLKRTHYGTLVWSAEKEDNERWVLSVSAFEDCNFSFIKREDDETWAVEDLLALEVAE